MTNKIEIIKTGLVKASKVYSDQTLIRAFITAIPYVGGSLDILLSSSGNTFAVRRIESFIADLTQEISNLKETQINKEYLQTEQGFDLIIKAFNVSARTRQAEKLNLYAKIVTSALLDGKEYEEDEPEVYLRIAEELSVKEFCVATVIYDLNERNKLDKTQEGRMGINAAILTKDYPEFEKDDLVSILLRVEKIGLIKELVGSYMDYEGGVYHVNPLLVGFMNFIELKSE